VITFLCGLASFDVWIFAIAVGPSIATCVIPWAWVATSVGVVLPWASL
jgi:hypothetical protein